MTRFPDFIIIGAMKSATSTLHEQLAAQAGFFMSDPKEIYFFSDNPEYAKGLDWYTDHFANAKETDLCGESTTHYTKLPTYPNTLARMREHVPNAKLIYMMRHPVERLVSQFKHHWTRSEIKSDLDINDAVEQMPILIDYSRYSYQLQPFIDTYGKENILPVFFPRFNAHNQSELERVCAFLDYEGDPQWNYDLQAQNQTSDISRIPPALEKIIEFPPLRALRQNIVPKRIRTMIRDQGKIKEPPKLTAEKVGELSAVFDKDLAILGNWLGVDLNCENFNQITRNTSIDWV